MEVVIRGPISATVLLAYTNPNTVQNYILSGSPLKSLKYNFADTSETMNSSYKTDWAKSSLDLTIIPKLLCKTHLRKPVSYNKVTLTNEGYMVYDRSYIYPL